MTRKLLALRPTIPYSANRMLVMLQDDDAPIGVMPGGWLCIEQAQDLIAALSRAVRIATGVEDGDGDEA